jgi:hypothetical protein
VANRVLTRDELNEALKPIAEALRVRVAATLAEMKPGEERVIKVRGFAPLLVRKPE